MQLADFLHGFCEDTERLLYHLDLVDVHNETFVNLYEVGRVVKDDFCCGAMAQQVAAAIHTDNFPYLSLLVVVEVGDVVQAQRGVCIEGVDHQDDGKLSCIGSLCMFFFIHLLSSRDFVLQS